VRRLVLDPQDYAAGFGALAASAGRGAAPRQHEVRATHLDQLLKRKEGRAGRRRARGASAPGAAPAAAGAPAGGLRPSLPGRAAVGVRLDPQSRRPPPSEGASPAAARTGHHTARLLRASGSGGASSAGCSLAAGQEMAARMALGDLHGVQGVREVGARLALRRRHPRTRGASLEPPEDE